MQEAMLEERLKAHHRSAFGWALHCCRGNREEAEEVLQETYLAILEGKASFSGKSSFRTWLFAVIRRKAGTARRRLARNLRLRRSQPLLPAPIREVSQEFERTRLRERIQRALARLSRRQREVLHLVFYEELSIQEAARVMGVSTGSARTHYHRGKQHLRRAIEGVEGNHEFRVGRNRNQAIL